MRAVRCDVSSAPFTHRSLVVGKSYLGITSRLPVILALAARQIQRDGSNDSARLCMQQRLLTLR
jgi:hypothetical protein